MMVTGTPVVADPDRPGQGVEIAVEIVAGVVEKAAGDNSGA